MESIDANSVTQTEDELRQLIEEIKDECERLVLLSESDSLKSGDIECNESKYPLLRSADSEADIDEYKDALSYKVEDEVKAEVVMTASDGVVDVSDKPLVDLAETEPKAEAKAVVGTNIKRIKNEKWGQSLDYFDEKGVQRRVLSFDEMKNYFELRSVQDEYKFYCSLVSDRYPRFYNPTPEYNQRWRMRYNVLVGKAFDGENSESLLHLGEIHLYFDLNPMRSSDPSYVNNSFYINTLPVELEITDEKMAKMKNHFDSLRFSRLILQMIFPMRTEVFKNCDKTFDKFIERQTELLEESESVYRKNGHKRRLYRDRGRGGPQQFNRRSFDRNSYGNFGRNQRDFEHSNEMVNKMFDRSDGRERRGRGSFRGRRSSDTNVEPNDRQMDYKQRNKREQNSGNAVDSVDNRQRPENNNMRRGRDSRRFSNNRMTDRRHSKTGQTIVEDRDQDRDIVDNRQKNRSSMRGNDREFTARNRGNNRYSGNRFDGKQALTDDYRNPVQTVHSDTDYRVFSQQ